MKNYLEKIKSFKKKINYDYGFGTYMEIRRLECFFCGKWYYRFQKKCLNCGQINEDYYNGHDRYKNGSRKFFMEYEKYNKKMEV